MAEAVAVASPVAEEATEGGGKKKLVLIVLGVLVAGAAAYMFLLGGGGGAEAEGPVEPVEGAVVPLAEMTTSLGGSSSTYVRIAFAGVLEASADETTIEERVPLMQDAALSVLMEFTADQLRTEQGAQQLRAALTDRAQQIWEEGEVLRVVLTDLLVQ